ncbi:hypothetical protein FOMPIDRAFT_115889 [Fomitopsis schrenkii]|uniref:Uncharacterized protein n=1 Tax=Fomitopsis schrenkii TaxID=2126942 RepID=S8FNW3_FOMSC|nr:hypothetical protein FOMPIDRAFT_115889 [Fomitopsis schrenkii]
MYSRPTTETGGIPQSGLPLYPLSFRTVDVKREVEKVRDAPETDTTRENRNTSMLGEGLSESYIRLRSFKVEKLKDRRRDFQASSIRDEDSREGWLDNSDSGSVYSVAFDQTIGSAAPPWYLVSASADAMTRLWSLDTMTNIVAYRGHQNPVSDVQWGPMGIYFAT